MQRLESRILSSKIEWGISAGAHDASLAVVDGDNILFASHSERFSGVKNDKWLNQQIIDEALKFGKPEKIHWYEKPWKRTARRLYCGMGWNHFSPKKYLKDIGIDVPIQYASHHESHAAAGFYTSPFFGSRVGLKPNEDEYILMGMVAYGDPEKYYTGIRGLWEHENLHRGCRGWRHTDNDLDIYSVAAATQKVYEEEFEKLLNKAKMLGHNQDNLVLMGGCALNCSANHIARKYFKNVWIMPNPGDAGSSIGAIAANNRRKLKWKGPYLGADMGGEYPVEKLLTELHKTGIVGVANGKAEFGPRALGNRSLLADPRGHDIKDKVNEIKQRQKFRPFAPVILAEHARDYFEMSWEDSPYMQYTSRCKYPDKFPAIVHADGTSRVQTVTKEQHPGLYELLTRWYEETGCPMLLNTSLNIKGMPMVNNYKDADDFEAKYGVKVFS